MNRKFLFYMLIVVSVIVIAFVTIGVPIWVFVSVMNDRKETNEQIVKTNNTHRSIYEIVYTDDGKDTISVWNEDIEVIAHRSFFGNTGSTYVEYTPYKEYDKLPLFKERIENVVRIKKLNN